MPSGASTDSRLRGGPTQEFLGRLGAGDPDTARDVLTLEPGPAQAGRQAVLPPRIMTLVRLASLVAVDAPVTTLRWAVDLAAYAGVGDDEIAGVLVAVGSDIGIARVVSAAPRLAMAIGYDVQGEAWGLN